MFKCTSWLRRGFDAAMSAFIRVSGECADYVRRVAAHNTQTRSALMFWALVFVELVGVVDCISPRELNFILFYFIGCVAAGWMAGARAAAVVALVCGVFSFFGSTSLASRNGIDVWNGMFELVTFMAVGFLASEAGRQTRGLESAVQQRTESLQTEIDEHRRTAGRLQETLQLFRHVTENITDVFWVADAARTRFSYVSPEFENVWGFSRRNVYVSAEAWMQAIHPGDRERVRQAAKPEAGPRRYDEEFRVIRPDRSIRWVHERAFPVRNDRGEVFRIVGISEDVTERVRLERQILEISDREQARIGQDIHDGLCQKLISLAFDVNALVAEASPEQAKRLGRVSDVLDESITESRRVARGLYPVRLETEGLVSALKELARTTAERFELNCACETSSDEVLCDFVSATHLYRIAQEGVTNAVKHSHCRNIEISLDDSGGDILLRIRDDGIGISGEKMRSGMGLCIMQYRARALGGALYLRHGEQKGTLISCRIPRHLPNRGATIHQAVFS